jgi:primosomal protein N''
MTKETNKANDPYANQPVSVGRDGKVDYSTMGQNFNKAITDEVDNLKSLGKEQIVKELHKYGFMEGRLGSDPAWLASKLRALYHAELKEHELTPEGYKQMLKDFGGKR